ncbi:MAG: ATP-binding protein, partial [Candidatus Aminicenantales bacterium]
MTDDIKGIGRPLKVLIVEDSEDDARLLVRELRMNGYDPTFERIETPDAMREALGKRSWDIVISDHVLPKFSGFAALDMLRETGLDLPFIIVSGNIGEDIAVEAMRAGAHDYIMKDNLKRLAPAVGRELRDAETRRERRWAQESLDRAGELLEKIFSITHIMVAYMDREFNFVRVNPAFAEAHGKSPETFPGKNYFTLCPGTSSEPDFRRVVETGEPFLTHAELFNPEGRPERAGAERYVNRAVQPVIGPDGHVEGVVLILLDVTRVVTLEGLIRQSQKMEALGILAGGIAHDFNNVLSAIVVNAEMALYDADKPEASKHHLPLVLEAANRGKDLVKQVLTFSRRSEQELRPTKISPVAREALKFLRASLPTTIDIRDRISATGDVVMADATQIYQVLMNLSSNAAHAMREQGGCLEISLEPVDIDGRTAASHPDLRTGPYIRLTVSDTGPGIPPDVLPKIFDPFFTTKKSGEGTGMGLAVVHGIVQRCGGAITVGVRAGQGTTFEVFLPRISDDLKEFRTSSGPIPRGRERILV